jgi:phosphoethanolamine N-methyltransferase
MSVPVEYHDAMINMLELIWGEGYMAPGGRGLVDKLVEGLALQDLQVLDIGSGLGGPCCHLARTHGARVTGVDIEPQLVDLANARAWRLGLQDRARFMLVKPGLLPFDDGAFDLVMSAGAFTQIADKAAVFAEVLRVLKPGGALRSFDWTKPGEAISRDLRYFFEMEGLTYALETPGTYARLLQRAGFVEVSTNDDTAWYRRDVRREYEQMKGPLYPQMKKLLGAADADHFVEDWRSMVVVFEKGELTQTLCRARKAE